MLEPTLSRRESVRDLTEQSPTTIKVLVKAGAILESFLVERRPLRVDEIAKRLGLSKTTAYRLVVSMERVGLLERDAASRGFRLGVKVLQLGVLAEEQLDVRQIARPVLVDLTAATGQTSFLTVLREYAGVCVERVAGSNVEILALKIGGALPLHCGAGPRVLLAGLSDDVVEEYIEATRFDSLTANTIVTGNELRRDVAETRAQRYVFSDEDVTPGVCALGSPVFDATGDVVAAVSIAALKIEYESRGQLAELVGATQHAGYVLSQRLGALPNCYGVGVGCSSGGAADASWQQKSIDMA